MHRLEDMRIITYAWRITKSLGRVDASGRLTTVEREITLDNPIPRSAWPIQRPLYQCQACGQDFDSWGEARLHIENPDDKQG